MPATPITDPVSGESLVGTEPQLEQQIATGYWRQRLNLYTGRTLTVDALDSEQNYRAGLLATLGQAVTAGTVTGLALTMDLNGADPMFSISPGYGIMANGQDVRLNTTLKTHLSSLTVIDAVTGVDLYSFRQSVGDPTNKTYAGILLLQPVIAQVSGEYLDTGSLPAIVSGNLGASCSQDPSEYAFEDWQIADAVRLVYLPWPAGVPTLELPPVEPAITWRNRLAYAIFNAEAQLGPDDQMPWAALGLPVALVAFDPGVTWEADTEFAVGASITDSNSNIQTVQTAGTSGDAQPAKWSTVWGGLTTDGSITWVNSGLAWKPLFVDCNAVVRAGGLPRNRYVLPSQPPPVQQWQPVTTFILTSGVNPPFIIDPNGNVQQITTAGQTGPVPPQWQTGYGQTTPDGAVVWTNNGPASWQANTNFQSGQFVFDRNGNQQLVTAAGISGMTEPDWSGIYLPTQDGGVAWVNNGTGNPPVVQPALAQARINQLSEQLSQAMMAQPSVTALAQIFSTMPPSGILPAAALDFTNRTAPWFPPNWSISAAPVFLEELETVLETGMLMDPIPAANAAPEDAANLEPVEVLVPLPDSVYDPNILVVETVPQVFYQELDQATDARNLSLQQLYTVKQELNTLFAAIGPNAPENPNLVDPNGGVTAGELAASQAPPPYTPTSAETFGTVLQSTWEPLSIYIISPVAGVPETEANAPPQLFAIDSNGAIQVPLNPNPSGALPPGGCVSAANPPSWNTSVGQTTSDGVIWVTRGNAAWQAKTLYTAGQVILDSNGNIQIVETAGTSGAAAPGWAAFNAAATAITPENAVVWTSGGNAAWQAGTALSAGHAIVDFNGNVEVVTTGGTSGSAAPAWTQTVGQTTADGGVTWTNRGHASWQPNTPFAVSSVIVDPTGTIEACTTAGTSGSSAPAWQTVAGDTTSDGLLWGNQGNAARAANTLYSTVGALIVDGNQFIQQVQSPGTSGAVQPAWNEKVGATTNDAAITWLNNGFWAWQPDTPYVLGQFVVDPQGFMQRVTQAGTSASEPPSWMKETVGTATIDGGVTWIAGGQNYWHADTAYAVNALIVDGNGNIQIAVTAGTSGAEPPVWDPNLQQITADPETSTGGLSWKNLGSATWQPGIGYAAGQAILDANGYIQTVSVAGVTAMTPPNWFSPETSGQTTNDGIVWQSGGSAEWRDDFLYASGQLILDGNGNIQIVKTGGISGDWPPSWNPYAGQTTQDSGVVWNNLGRSAWQANALYSAGQAILDSNHSIQIVLVGGTSGAAQPDWSEGGTTQDTSVEWTIGASLLWNANAAYVAGQIVIDANGNLQLASVLDASGSPQAVGTVAHSGATAPAWNTTPGGTTTDGGITWIYLAYYSSNLLQVESVAAEAPYTITYQDSTGQSHTISLLTASDISTLQTNGLQALITSLKARISKANDLLDTGFLTAQTDIYRFRNYVLGAAAATSLATSTVLANIAKGESAAATAENLQNYIGTVLPPPPATTTSTTSDANGATTTTTTSTTNPSTPVYTRPIIGITKVPVIATANPILFKSPIKVITKPLSVRSRAVMASLSGLQTGIQSGIQTGIFQSSSPVIERNLPIFTSTVQTPISQLGKTVAAQAQAGTSTASNAFAGALLNKSATVNRAILAGPAQIVNPGQNAPATTSDITSQSPLVGAQVNVRTLTIAERLQQSPSQEAMFYAISNRLNFLNTLAQIENDLNLVADDLPILVDTLPTAPSTVPVALPPQTRTFSEFLGAANAGIMAQIQSPYFGTDASEGTLFSVGVRVVEQHTQMLRALEARVQQYTDFVSLCTTAVGTIKTDIQQAQAYIAQLTNNLQQDRQNVAFTSALLADEIQQVQSTNTQRQQVLATTVHLIAYTRARTLEATDTVPSRQLEPATVANPVPACLQQSVAIPPELREIVGQLREAPVNWMPSINAQVSKLERPVLLQQLATSIQSRAVQLLQAPRLPSSAEGETGMFATAIASVFTANQQIFHSYVAQRATVQTASLTTMSWTSQVTSLQSIAAVNDLISADSVHTEVSNAVARLIQQISSVATCLYTRASIEDPIDRLAWAQYLSGPGISVQLQSLAILPSWNQLTYTDRQQMQMLVDWLFLQIDTSISAATAFMSDVVRTAILLASDVPVDNIISGNIIARVQPAVGATVTLNLASERIASGMFVNLYSGATLAARGVVSDIDTGTVSAKVTDVYSPGTYLETTDTAHFTTLTPQAIALRPLML